MVKTELVEIHPITDGTIYAKVLDERDFTVEELVKTYEIFEKQADKTKYKVVIDARNITVGHIPTEAFKINSSKTYTPNQIAEAYLFNGLHTRILINFYFKIFKPAIPSRMFECPEEANKWLANIETKGN